MAKFTPKKKVAKKSVKGTKKTTKKKVAKGTKETKETKGTKKTTKKKKAPVKKGTTRGNIEERQEEIIKMLKSAKAITEQKAVAREKVWDALMAKFECTLGSCQHACAELRKAGFIDWATLDEGKGYYLTAEGRKA